MSFVDDSVGKRFGRLVVTNVVTGNRRRMANCRCDCGKEVTVDPRMLKRGDTTSCGCYHKQVVRALRSPDLAGQKFHMLEVLARGPQRPVGTKKRLEHTWNCKCECGQLILVTTNSLKSGNTRSCGCLRTVTAQARQQQGYQALVNMMKARSQKRGYEWELSDEEAEHLITQDCTYCGQEPALGARYSYLVRNGIDRVDNKLGYIPGNCVTACKTCNQMKHALGIDAFKSHIERLSKHLKESA